MKGAGLRHKWQWGAIVLVAVACFLFFQLAYPNHFFYKEQNQLFLLTADYAATYTGCGWAARWVGDFLTQLYYYMYAGAALLSLALLLVGLLLYGLLRRCGLKRWASLAAAVGAMLLEADFHLHHSFPLSATLSLAGWLLALWAVLLLVGRRAVGPVALRLGRWGLALSVLLLAAWLAGVPRVGRLGLPNWYLEQQLAVDNAYYFGRHDRVVQLVEEAAEPTPEMKFFYYMVQARRGELPDHLLHFDRPDLGTFYRIGPETPLLTIKNMNELYWTLGDMTFTERAAMMANVFSPNNRNVRMVKRLAEVNIVSGDTLAAKKYLRLLSHTLVYADWARTALSNPAYSDKARYNNQQDTIALTDNAHFLMMQLLDSNPQNTVALDYILCSDLLLKDITNFKRDYDRYCTGQPRLKTLYQEALCIWLAGTEASPDEWRRYILMPEVADRFRQYNQQRAHPQFKNTYWYYFDKAPIPQL